MKITALITLLWLAASNTGIAQNWQTIPLDDTVYFSAGPHASMPQHASLPEYISHASTYSSTIRANFVRLNVTLGQDREFLLPRCKRDTTQSPFNHANHSNCMDTLSPSWLGKMCIRQLNGVEYYYNSKNDTITLQTFANLGASWILAKNTAGLIFKATVVQAGITIVDGVTDSFKTLSIQAFNGSTPVSHWYNSLVLQFSKAHGWLKTLDFYRFPNSFTHWDYGGEFLDSTQHVRLPVSIKTTPLMTDSSWIYTAGNEWIAQSWRGSLGEVRQHAQHDSIISASLIPGNALRVTIKTKIFEDYGRPYDTASYIHIDTVGLNGAVPHLASFYYGGPFINAVNSTPLITRFFVDTVTLCGKYFIERDLLTSCGGPQLVGSCYKFDCLDGMNVQKSKYLAGFGQIYNYSYYSDLGMYDLYKEDVVTYLKIGNCTTGKKINVYSFLGVAEKMRLAAIVQPNPATDQLKVTLPGSISSYRIGIRDMTGALIFQQESKTSTTVISTRAYPAGVYFLEVWAEDYRQIVRVIISH